MNDDRARPGSRASRACQGFRQEARGNGGVAGPEDKARENIDRLLRDAGWHVVDPGEVKLHAFRGTTIREFPLESGYGFADYLLYVNCRAVGDGEPSTGKITRHQTYIKDWRLDRAGRQRYVIA